jgi:hypothetical protein
MGVVMRTRFLTGLAVAGLAALLTASAGCSDESGSGNTGVSCAADGICQIICADDPDCASQATGAAGGADVACPQGSEACPCYGDGTCDQGLTCTSSLCVDLGRGGSTGSGGAGPASSAGAAGASHVNCNVVQRPWDESAVCPASPNLVNKTGWVGCDPADPSDNPMGIQGDFYTFGDGIACAPPQGNPCASGACCLSGSTVEDPTYAAWGCGIGLQLQGAGWQLESPADCDDPFWWFINRNPYTGSASCFELTFSGDSGGNPVRICFTQVADDRDKECPFVEIGPVDGAWSGTVCFGDVRCGEWTNEDRCSITGEVYDLQFMVAGGQLQSTFTLCLDSLIPNDPKATGGSG